MGLFDEVAADLAETMIDLATDDSWTFERARITVEPGSGREVHQKLAEVEAKIMPPYAVKLGQVDGTNILADDRLSIVATAALGGFDLEPASGIGLSVRSPRGKRYAIARVEPLPSGDEIAAYGLQLR